MLGIFRYGNYKRKNPIYICTDLYILKQVKERVQQGVSSKQIYTPKCKINVIFLRAHNFTASTQAKMLQQIKKFRKK